MNGKWFTKIIYIVSCFCCFVFLNPATAVAQKNEKNKAANKNENPKTDPSLPPPDQEMVYFKNLNAIPYYFDSKKIGEIGKLESKGDKQNMYLQLLKYVQQFGIENFFKNNFFLWALGKLSEELGYLKQAKSLYRYVLKHHRSGNIQEARLYYDSLVRNDMDYYLPVAYYYQLIEARKAIDEKYAVKGRAIRLEKEINDTTASDYGPTLAKQGERIMMIFTSNRNLSQNNRSLTYQRKDSLVPPNEDLFVTTKMDTFYLVETEIGRIVDTVKWKRAEPLYGLNSIYNEGSASISRDGQTIYFSRCDSPDGFGSCDLYMAEKKDTLWGNVRNLGIEVNSMSWESHPSLSHTEDTLFFASDRLGGFGMADIYLTYKVRDESGNWNGKWSRAQNLGPTVNTRLSEVSPFYHPRYPVLYFSSNGQLVNFGYKEEGTGSLNSFDIYKTRQEKMKVEADGQAKDVLFWTEPKNVGPLINTKGDEYYFAIDEKAEMLYFAKTDTVQYFKKAMTKKGLDTVWYKKSVMKLYSFPLPMEAQPNAVVLLKGSVKDSITGEVLSGIISIIDLDNGIEVAPKYLRPDGTYEFELIRNNKYLVVITGDDFFRVEREFLLEGDTVLNVETPSMKFQKWKFSSIEFQPGAWDVTAEMEPDLQKLVTFLVDHPNLGLRVTGHTEVLGDANYNLELSQSRADAIKVYINKKGKFKSDRVIAIGYGGSQPIVSEERSDDDKKLNRRVEFEILRLEEN